MIIVSGWLRVAADARQPYLEACQSDIELARAASGCLDFYLSEDPLDPGRINVFERWVDVDSVERFRTSGPSNAQQAIITDAQVEQYVIASVTSLT